MEGKIKCLARKALMLVCMSAALIQADAARAQRGEDGQLDGCLVVIESIGLCHPDNWASFIGTDSRLHGLATKGRYQELEQTALEASRSDGAGDGSDPATAVYSVLDSWASEAAKGQDEVLRDWDSEVPGSPFVSILRAMQLRDRALKIAGRRSFSTLPPETRALFVERIDAARALIAKVQGPARDSLVWHALSVQLDSYRPGEPVSRQLTDASLRWPRNLFLYAAAGSAKAYLEDWIGLDNVIALAVERTQKTDGLEYYARLYSLHGPWNASRATQMNWPLMKAGFQDWGARDPSWNVRNLYGAYACANQDGAAFRQAMGAPTTSQLRPEAWLPGYPYEACVRWASTRT